MPNYIPRAIEVVVRQALDEMPVVALLGARQSGKSTVARHLFEGRDDVLYLDLERPFDLRRLSEPESLFDANWDRLICIDEIQRKPDIFPVLRYVVDKRARNGQFLLLGSASRDLIEQASETLAGRIRYLELSPFLRREIEPNSDLIPYWLRGGFPRSLLAPKERESFEWRLDFIRGFLERDVPLMKPRLSSPRMEQLWTILAHCHGQLLNKTMLARSLEVDAHTISSYLDLLEASFMIRRLFPFFVNLKKRLVKSPKIYVRDSGILHALLNITSTNDLFGHPIRGSSWEGLVIDNILSQAKRQVRGYFYRTARGAEIDLVLEMGMRRIVFEAKASQTPRLEKGFQIAMEDIEPEQAWVVAPVESGFAIENGARVISIEELPNVPELCDWLLF